jgi:membrane protease YdiL (CAAX protease family)
MQCNAEGHISAKSSILALLLIVPVTSVGAVMSTLIAPGALGQGIAIFCGIWLLFFPLLWHRYVDLPWATLRERQPLNLKLSRDGWWTGVMLGILMFGVIICSYWFVGRYWLNIADIRSRTSQMGMNIPLMVFGFGTFQTSINSLIEEYVWRWFVYRHCQVLWSPRWAILMSAGFFTIHHVFLLVAYCDNLWLVLVGSIAVFMAGVVWAVCMRVYKSLLPSYLSHLAADLALQMASWHILLS